MRPTRALTVLLTVACGGAPVPALAPTAPRAEPEPAVLSAVAPVAEREVVIDGVRDPTLIDELDGWQLVSGAGTLGLVGPDGHVRASVRLGYGGGGTDARFFRSGEVIAGSADSDGFRGPYSGRLIRWDVDTSTFEQLAELGYGAPTIARLGEHVLVAGTARDGIFELTESGIEQLAEQSEILCWAAHEVCALTDGNMLGSLARRDATGALRVEPAPEPWEVLGATGIAVREDRSLVWVHDGSPFPLEPGETFQDYVLRDSLLVAVVGRDGGPTRDVPLPTSSAGSGPAPVASRGARGISGYEWAPRSNRMVLATSADVVVIGADGIRYMGEANGDAQWPFEPWLTIGRQVVPLDRPSQPSNSTRTDVPTYWGEWRDDVPAPMAALIDWARDEDAEAPTLGPICNAARPQRCVRTRPDREVETGVGSWEVFDPARPRRVLRAIEADVPAIPSIGLVGSRWVRVIAQNGLMRLEPLAAGAAFGSAEPWLWVEVASGWGFVRMATELVFAPDGPGDPLRRSFDAAILSLTIADDTHVILAFDARLEVVELPTLDTVATYVDEAADPVRRWRCDGDDVEDQMSGERLPGACPMPVEDDFRTPPNILSFDRTFWAEPRGESVWIQRTLDGARLHVRITTEGVLVVGPGGVFEATGTIGDHLVVRDPGPVRTAVITTGAEARARFERPGLVAAFFSGQPLP